jgi:hypothetical protein
MTITAIDDGTVRASQTGYLLPESAGECELRPRGIATCTLLLLVQLCAAQPEAEHRRRLLRGNNLHVQHTHTHTHTHIHIQAARYDGAELL